MGRSDFFLLDVGVEAGRGRQFPAGPAGGRNKNGVSSGNVFTHVGGDFGTGTAWQTGVSYLSTSPRTGTLRIQPGQPTASPAKAVFGCWTES